MFSIDPLNNIKLTRKDTLDRKGWLPRRILTMEKDHRHSLSVSYTVGDCYSCRVHPFL